MTANLRGIVAICAAMALFVVNDTLVKIAAAELPTHQIIFLRGVMASALVGAAVLGTGAFRAWRALAHPAIIGRSLLEAFVAYTYIAALATLGVADATAILLLSPLLITAFGALVLGEDVRWRRWAAIGVGFLGMLLVVRPSGGVFGPGAALALASTIGVAARDLLTKSLPQTAPTLLVTAATVVAVTLLSGLGALAQPWEPLRPPILASLAVAAALVVLGNFAIIAAFRDVDVSVVSPFRYTIIVWAVGAGYVAFGDLPSGIAWIGIALIVASGLYAMVRETVAERRGRG